MMNGEPTVQHCAVNSGKVLKGYIQCPNRGCCWFGTALIWIFWLFSIPICALPPRLSFLTWHRIHHLASPIDTFRSPINIQRSLVPHTLIMSMFSKVHWLLREAKNPGWTRVWNRARVCAQRGGGSLQLVSIWALCLCWAQINKV